MHTHSHAPTTCMHAHTHIHTHVHTHTHTHTYTHTYTHTRTHTHTHIHTHTYIHTNTHTHTHKHTHTQTHTCRHESSNGGSLQKLVCQVGKLTSEAARLKIELEVTRADLEKSREERLEVSRKLLHTRQGRPDECLTPRTTSRQIEVCVCHSGHQHRG